MSIHNKNQWDVYESGVVSYSGFGDGAYDIYTAKVNNKVVGISMDFGVSTCVVDHRGGVSVPQID